MKSRKPSSSLIPITCGALLLIGCAHQSQEFDNPATTENNQRTALEKQTQIPQSSAAPSPAPSQAPSKMLDQAEARPRLSAKPPSTALQEVLVSASKRESMAAGLGAKNAVQASRLDTLRHPREITDRERYDAIADNAIKLVSETPVSTFSIDVDSASYSNVRRILNQGRLPRHDAVRAEEFINYFTYTYPTPGDNQAFASYTEIGPSPWATGKQLLHIGLQGLEPDPRQRPDSNLVFLLDVSGSMHSANKLPLLKSALKMLVSQLHSNDSVAIVVYAGAAGVVLEPSNNPAQIIQALEQLSAGGSTNGGAGIHAAYQLAQAAYKPGGINRIILCTDGDFNVGTVNQRALQELISHKRQSGVGLTVLGFGMGNYNDAFAQTLAQHGNGNAYYIDTLREARKVLVDELSSTLHTIAKDVKIQIEFNPATVAEYRLIGYETRLLRREDFRNDKVDAGEIGAGHSVTALYEITLANSTALANEPLRYAKGPAAAAKAEMHNELAYLRLRYKRPDAGSSTLLQKPIYRSDIIEHLADTSEDFRFAASVAAFAQLLKNSSQTQSYSFQDVLALAEQSRGRDQFGYRSEMLQLVRLAESVASNAADRQPSQASKPTISALTAQP